LDYRLQIAKRYLRSGHSFSLISKITGISIAGVALGVAALIVVLSVMNGFFDFVRDMLVSYDPHVRVVAADRSGLVQVDSLMDVVSRLPGIQSAAPYVEGKALLLHEGKGDVNKVVIVRGVDKEQMSANSNLIEGTVFGRFDVTRQGGRPGIVLGEQLGERLLLAPKGGTSPASSVALLSAPALESRMTQVFGAAPVRRFEVRGLFRLEPVYDESHVFIGLDEARNLFRMGKAVSGLDIRLDDLNDAESIKRLLEARLDQKRFRVMTWYDLQKTLYDVMHLEKWGASLILVLIIVVAVFNIVGSLTMIVIEKRRDVGALRAMGVTKKDVRRIFLNEGLLIGVLGSGVGLILGLGLALAQKYFQIVPLARAESFLIDAYPVSIEATDVALITIVALILCVLAAWYPAARASGIEPAEAVASRG
jgi:lipoprotein-releasing system permease protein